MPALPTPGTEKPLYLVEVFSSVQGEGILIGRRQVFIRLAGCNLSCRYCDTPVDKPESCSIESVSGSGRLSSAANPVSRQRVLDQVRQWREEAPRLHHSISITGGEPLVQGEALTDWLPALREIMPVCLETNGTLPDAFAAVKDSLDFISMDIKLPSSTGCPGHWEVHERFLTEAGGLEGQAKVVIEKATPEAEIERAARLLAAERPEWPLVLQPVTISGRPGIDPQRLLRIQTALSHLHRDVRVIPQTHPLLGIL